MENSSATSFTNPRNSRSSLKRNDKSLDMLHDLLGNLLQEQ